MRPSVGINRQPREVVAEPRECALFIQRAEFLEQRVAAGDGGGRGRIDKRKRLDVAQAERLHAQNDLGQVGALDFRLRERRPRVEILLRIEPDANAVLHAAARPLRWLALLCETGSIGRRLVRVRGL